VSFHSGFKKLQLPRSETGRLGKIRYAIQLGGQGGGETTGMMRDCSGE
jgi:hypothetical protein